MTHGIGCARIGLFVVALAACRHGAASHEIPADLLRIEELAEDAYDQALAQNYSAVASDADEIDTTWQGFRSQAQHDGATAGDLAAMDGAIAQLHPAAATPTDAPSVARAANAVSATMDELFALYDPVVPPGVLALDYLGREVVIDALESGFVAAASHADAIDTQWQSLRQQVIDAGGTKAVDDYEAAIATTRADITAMDSAKLVTDANAELEVVDEIERVFED